MTIRKTSIAAFAALAVIAAGTTFAPTQAVAGNNFVNGLVGGLIVGGIVAASQNRYGTVYAPTYSSCRTQWETRYNSYGQPYSVKVKYCY